MDEGLEDAAPQERRDGCRQRVLKGALVVFGDHNSAIDCQIRNLSEVGTMLTLASMIGVPEAFEWLTQGDRRIAPAQVVWRTDREIGVELTGPWREQAGRR